MDNMIIGDAVESENMIIGDAVESENGDASTKQGTILRINRTKYDSTCREIHIKELVS